jgi:hypothetical protein
LCRHERTAPKRVGPGPAGPGHGPTLPAPPDPPAAPPRAFDPALAPLPAPAPCALPLDPVEPLWADAVAAASVVLEELEPPHALTPMQAGRSASAVSAANLGDEMALWRIELLL